MISRSLIIQLCMIAIAAVIWWLFILPIFDSIKTSQQTTAHYQAEIEKVNSVNATLQKNQTLIESISLTNQQRLDRFMPTDIDTVAVLRELQYLLEQYDVTITALSAEAGTNATANSDVDSDVGDAVAVLSPIQKTPITVSFVSSYAVMKEVLAKLERNDYVYEIAKATITPGASDDDSASPSDTVTVLLNITVSKMPIKTIDSSVSDATPTVDALTGLPLEALE